MTGPFTLSPLPYDADALEPTIAAKTVGFHYHKHHQGYVDTLNTLVSGTRYADMPLEEIVRATAGKSAQKEAKIFNNAAQVWNHDFYWNSLSPTATILSGRLKQAVERDFGGAGALIEELATAGTEQFGSGWAWLVSKGGVLAIEKTHDAVNPMSKGINCLIGIDVWEHAYYLDYQDERPKYLQGLLENLLNWNFAAENLDKEDHIVRAAAE